jgi:hypothetical protein
MGRGRCHRIIKQYLYLPKLLQTIYVIGMIFGLDNYHKNISFWVSPSAAGSGAPGIPKEKKTVDQEYS